VPADYTHFTLPKYGGLSGQAQIVRRLYTSALEANKAEWFRLFTSSRDPHELSKAASKQNKNSNKGSEVPGYHEWTIPSNNLEDAACSNGDWMPTTSFLEQQMTKK